jgi:hypothetical protein
MILQDLLAELVQQLLVSLAEVGFLKDASALMASAETPASMAFLTCAFQEYCASRKRAVISRLSSLSRASREDSKRQYAPSASTFSASSGLRSQTRNGPRVPPRRALIRSLISCWRGDSSVSLGSRIVFALSSFAYWNLVNCPSSAPRQVEC